MINKYSTITTIGLYAILIIILVLNLDNFILPQNSSEIKVVHTERISVSSKGNRHTIGYKYFTDNGLFFTTQEDYIYSKNFYVSQTYLFNNIVSIRSTNNDYTSKLMSGFNGATFYFSNILALASLISLFLLKRKKELSSNSFQNIILLHSFMIFIILYILTKYN